MTYYNLRTNQASPDLPFTIIKFSNDLNPESSYSVGLTACECPAGHRPTCRHRTMLPNLRQRVDSAWFWNFEAKAWEDPTGEAQKHQEVEDHDAVTGGLDADIEQIMPIQADEGLVAPETNSQALDYNLDPVDRTFDNAIEVEEQLAVRGEAIKPAPSANLAQGFRRRL